MPGLVYWQGGRIKMYHAPKNHVSNIMLLHLFPPYNDPTEKVFTPLYTEQ